MKIDNQRADFESWALGLYSLHKQDSGEYSSMVTHGAWEAWQAALESPGVQALRDALQEVVDAADGDGWNVLDASLEKQRAALAAMEKQK